MQFMQFRESMNLQLHNNLHTQNKETHLQNQVHLAHLNNNEIEKNLPFFGAGEAMCSTAELEFGNGNSKSNNFLKQSLNDKKKILDLNSKKMIFPEVN